MNFFKTLKIFWKAKQCKKIKRWWVWRGAGPLKFGLSCLRPTGWTRLHTDSRLSRVSFAFTKPSDVASSASESEVEEGEEMF